MANEVSIRITADNEASAGFKAAKKDADEYGGGLAGVGDRADASEQRVVGLKDTIDGTAAIMAGPGKDGIGAYLQGWADLASGIANFVIPSLVAVATQEGRAAIATALATAKTWAANIATKAYAAGQWLLNAALSANPIGLIIIALVALAAALIIAYKRSATFRAIVQSAFAAVKVAINILVSVARTYFGIWAGILRGAASAASSVAGRVRSVFSSLVSFIRSIPGRVRGALSGMFNPIVNAARNAYGRARSLLGQLINYARSIPSQIGNSIKGMIPGFAHGGVVGQAATGGGRSGLTAVGEHGPELLSLPPGTRVRSNPDSRRMATGGGQGMSNVTITIDGTGVLQGLRKVIRVQGGDVQEVLGR
jgi:phage-related protein